MAAQKKKIKNKIPAHLNIYFPDEELSNNKQSNEEPSLLPLWTGKINILVGFDRLS